MAFWKRVKILEKPQGPPEPQSQPYRDLSPSSEPPRSVPELERQERNLIELLRAIQEHNPESISRALSVCQDVNFMDYEIKPLVFASHLGQLDTVKSLVAKGADIRLPSKIPFFVSEQSVCYNEHTRELTPTEAARHSGHTHVIEFLESNKV